MQASSDCHSDDPEICDEIERYREDALSVYHFTLQFSLFTDVIVLIASGTVLAIIVCKYKRSDWFLILTPLFFFLYGLLYIPYDSLRLFDTHHSNEKLQHALEITGFFFQMMGHWAFAA